MGMENIEHRTSNVERRMSDGASLQAAFLSRRIFFMTELPITVYTPESPLRNPGRFVREMFRDLLASRELAWRLFVRDTSAQYRQSFLGYLWAFIPPLVASLPFIFLNSQGVVNMGATKIPYPAYAMIGTIIWQVFVDALNSPLKTAIAAKSMPDAHPILPREADSVVRPRGGDF